MTQLTLQGPDFLQGMQEQFNILESRLPAAIVVATKTLLASDGSISAANTYGGVLLDFLESWGDPANTASDRDSTYNNINKLYTYVSDYISDNNVGDLVNLNILTTGNFPNAIGIINTPNIAIGAVTGTGPTFYPNGTMIVDADGNPVLGQGSIAQGTITANEMGFQSVNTTNYVYQSVDNSALAPNAVATPNIQQNAVVGATQEYNATTGEPLTDNNGNYIYTPGSISQGAVGPYELGFSAINSTNFMPGAVDNGAMGPNAVGTPNIQQNAVVGATQQYNATTGEPLTDNNGDYIYTPGSIAQQTITPYELGAQCVNTTNFIPGAVDNIAMGPNAVDTPNIRPGAVTGSFVNNTDPNNPVVTPGSIAPQTITYYELAQPCVNSSNFIPGAVDNNALGLAVVETANMAIGSVTGSTENVDANDNIISVPGIIALQGVTLKEMASGAVTGSNTTDPNNIAQGVILQGSITAYEYATHSVMGTYTAGQPSPVIAIAGQTVGHPELAISAVFGSTYNNNNATYTTGNVAPNSITPNDLGYVAIATGNTYTCGSQPVSLSGWKSPGDGLTAFEMATLGGLCACPGASAQQMYNCTIELTTPL